jgi:hypothetical protein
MVPINADRSVRHALRETLFPERPRFFPWARVTQLLLRSLHIAAMAMVVGALPFGAGLQQLRAAILVTLVSGLLLFAIDLGRDMGILVQGSGVAVLLKLSLLGMGFLQPSYRLPWYVAATLVASIGSHMPGAWRHFSFLRWKVLTYRN